MEVKSADELFNQLKELDPKRAENIDRYNKRRLIRAIEIILKTGKEVPKIESKKPDFEVLILGVKRPKTELNNLIEKRLLKRLKNGMIEEVKSLHKSGIS